MCLPTQIIGVKKFENSLQWVLYLETASSLLTSGHKTYSQPTKGNPTEGSLLGVFNFQIILST